MFRIQYVINVVMTIPTLLYIDKWGRRPLLLWGALLMALWLFIVGGVMGQYGNPVPSIQGNSNLTWQVTGPPSKAVIACTYLFVATFAPTWLIPGLCIDLTSVQGSHRMGLCQ
jgi:Sugar (and other) transporter